MVLKDYIDHGVWSFIHPLQGYLVLPTRFINIISFKLCFTHYPLVSFVFTVIFTWIVIAAVALAPTHLKHPRLCALVALLIPTGPEVFGVPLYSFWWGTLLLFLSLLWREDVHPRVRAVFLFVGGLSSPMIIPVSFLFLLKFFYLKTRLELVFVLVAFSLLCVQSFFLWWWGTESMLAQYDLSTLNIIASKFFGWFLFREWVFLGVNHSCAQFAGFALILALVVFVFRTYRRGDLKIDLVILFFLFGLSILSSVSRIDVKILQPENVGARYFFFPWIVLLWILIQFLAHERTGHLKLFFLTTIIVAVMMNNQGGFSRHHEPLSWKENLELCQESTTPLYEFPVHTTGKIEHAWSIQLTSDDCRRLVDSSLF